jgi:CheY-like chemotaxis protein
VENAAALATAPGMPSITECAMSCEADVLHVHSDQVPPVVFHGGELPNEVAHPTILVVDDDLGTRQTVALAFSLAGVRVAIAGCGADALIMARSLPVDLLVIDLRLDDMSGLNVVRMLNRLGVPLPFVVISAFLTVEHINEAKELGAIEVIEKPFMIDDMTSLLLRVLAQRRAPSHRNEHRPPSPRDTAADGRATNAAAPVDRVDGALAPPFSTTPKSAAQRWASYVIRACESEADFKTLDDWARFVGVSYSSLRESCRLVGVLAHDARDFVRVLRALISVRQGACTHPEVLFDVSDTRTLQSLLTRAGLESGGRLSTLSVDDFLERQQFISLHSGALQACRRLLRDRFAAFPPSADPK